MPGPPERFPHMTRRDRFDSHVSRAVGVLSNRLTLGAALVSGATLLSVGLSGNVYAADYPITAKQRGTAQKVAQDGVALSELAPNAPDTYTVKTRDTLWDISKMYLKSP